MMREWCVVQTRINGESLAARHLQNQGFDVYLPKIKKQRRHARRVDMVFAPMFPRYLFVRLSALAPKWRSVNGTIGVSYMICHGDEPALVPEGIVEEIMSRENDEGVVAPHKALFKPGERLRMLDGAFTDQIGLFEEMADDKRVIMLLELMGRQVRVKAPVAHLAVAS
jgi:transcriptional antiterminator RfaH